MTKGPNHILLIILMFFGGQLLAQNGNWDTNRPDIPFLSSGHNTCVIGDEIYFFGGYECNSRPNEPRNAMNRVFKYNTKSKVWTTGLSPMPTARGEAAIGLVKGIVYIIGGFTGLPDSKLNLVEAYDPLNDKWDTNNTPMPTRRYGSAYCVIDGEIWVMGGYGPTVNASKDVEIYNPQTDKWRISDPLLTARCRTDAIYIDNKIYLAGGSTAHYPLDQFSANLEMLSSIEYYDLDTKRWLEAPFCLPQKIGMLGALGYDNKLYYFGGYFYNTHHPVRHTTLENVFFIDLKTGLCQYVTKMPTGREYPAIHFLDGKIYTAGGQRTHRGNRFCNEHFAPVMEVYEPVENPVYAYDVKFSKKFVEYKGDTVAVTCKFINPINTKFEASLEYYNPGNNFKNRIPMMDDGLHQDGLAGDKIYGGYINFFPFEDNYEFGIRTSPPDGKDTFLSTDNSWKVTRVGPVEVIDVDFIFCDSDGENGNTSYKLYITLKNTGVSGEAKLTTASCFSLNKDLQFPISRLYFGNIPPGEAVRSRNDYIITFCGSDPEEILDLKITTYCDEVPYWADSYELDLRKGSFNEIPGK